MAKRTEGSVAGSQHPATDLAAASRQLLNGSQRHLDAAELREALLDLHELWLTTKAAELGITPGSGFALVATGGLGRREFVPYSDLDLMLLHDNQPADVVSEIAEALWYPLWDANIRLDHSVRTVSEALQVAATEISAGMVRAANGAPVSPHVSTRWSSTTGPGGSAAGRSPTARSLI